LVKKAFGLNIDITPETDYVHRPTLNTAKLKNATGVKVPSWEEMMEELANNKNFYKSL
jgi:hypothetical protein